MDLLILLGGWLLLTVLQSVILFIPSDRTNRRD